jgi:opacity protein-like surface antigen
MSGGLCFASWAAVGCEAMLTLNVPGMGWNGSRTDGGWLIGGGVEYGFKARCTVKLEYDYLTQSNWTSTTVPALPEPRRSDDQGWIQL